MSFNKYPYTDFHEMNDDWLILKVKELMAAWADTKEDWEQVQADWETQQQAFDDLKSFCENYFNDLDISTEINNKIDAMVAAGTFGDLLEPYVTTNLPTAVSTWLAAHVDPDTGYVIDDSLSITDAAADAKVVGDKLKQSILADTTYLADNTDLNTLNGNGVYMLVDSYTYPNKPTGMSLGFIINTHPYLANLQIAIDYNSNKVWIRRNLNGGAWSSWKNYTDDTLAGYLGANNVLANNTDLNTLYSYNKYWLMTGDNTYTNAPAISDKTGLLINYAMTSSSAFQIFVPWTAATIYKRRYLGGSWADWVDITGALLRSEPSILANNTDLNTITTNSVYMIADTYTYSNVPTGFTIGYIINMHPYVSNLQMAIDFNTMKVWIRRNLGGGSWSDWKNYTDTALLQYLGVGSMSGLATNTDLNSLYSYNKYWLMDGGRTYTNAPPITDKTGLLINYNATAIIAFQIFIPWTAATIYKRRYLNGTWGDWVAISGGNSYTFNEYSNTYNVTASPEITTDTNAFLAASGDNTDRTSDIVTMLTTYGICRLGIGDYYVTDLEMVDNSSIIGVGYGSRIILAGASDGYAIKMGDYNTISNVHIAGSTSDITPSSTLGDRHGILWQGNYTQSESADAQPKRGLITGCWISGFTGGGITCYDTGYSVWNDIIVSDTRIYNCGAGINISYLSEFLKFTNVKCDHNFYGCINNGGNNTFTSCDFSNNILGFLIDDSSSQSPNNGHGSAVGCVFNHSNANAGIGIKILGSEHGFVFDGCQIFYSQIDIEQSNGIVVSSCNFGYSNCNITIVDGNTMLFTDCMFQQAPTITVTNNTKTHFINCYERTSGNSVSPT